MALHSYYFNEILNPHLEELLGCSNDRARATATDLLRYNNQLINRNTMKLTTIAKRLFDADTKKLVKANLLTKDLELTEDGRAELWAIIFQTNKEELVKVAGEILEQRKNN